VLGGEIYLSEKLAVTVLARLRWNHDRAKVGELPR
jgi:hypothetical protein